jgi:hypothetical protein
MRGLDIVAINAESQFVELVRSWLVSLPHDLKIAFDAMDDENLPRPTRELATGEDEEAFKDRFPELFENLDQNLALCKSVMGELMAWLESKVGSLKTASYKGKKLATYLDNEEAREQLVDDGLVFRTDYPVDEKTIGDKLKRAATIIETMKRTRADEARAKGISA